MVIDELSRQGVAPLHFDADAFAVRIGGPDSKELLFLGNYYAGYRKASRKERGEVVVQAAAQWIHRPIEVPKTFAEAREILRPAVRSLAYYDVSNLRLEVERISDRITPFATIGRHLAVGLALDYPTSVSMVGQKDLASWGVDFEEAQEAALAALRQHSAQSFSQTGGLFVSSWRDTYDATRILLSDLVTALPVRGRHVALVPHRNMLLVTGSDDVAGLQAMASAAVEMFGEPQPTSTWPLVFDEGTWRDWSLDPDHPAARAFKLLQLRSLSNDYAAQGELLKVLAERREDGPYIASYSATQHAATGTLSSFTSWTDEVETLLPEAERISFTRVHSEDNVEPLGWVMWDEVRRVVPNLLEPTDHYPPRWHVRGFPTAAQFEQMAKV